MKQGLRGESGRPGLPGESGKPGLPGLNGQKGERGEDGAPVSIFSFMTSYYLYKSSFNF